MAAKIEGIRIMSKITLTVKTVDFMFEHLVIDDFIKLICEVKDYF